jgi:hypothetical protein
MVTDISTGIGYVFQNIKQFGGDPNRSETRANALFMDVLRVNFLEGSLSWLRIK